MRQKLEYNVIDVVEKIVKESKEDGDARMSIWQELSSCLKDIYDDGFEDGQHEPCKECETNNIGL